MPPANYIARRVGIADCTCVGRSQQPANPGSATYCTSGVGSANRTGEVVPYQSTDIATRSSNVASGVTVGDRAPDIFPCQPAESAPPHHRSRHETVADRA